MKTFKTQQGAVDRARSLLTAVFNGSPAIQDSWNADCTVCIFIPYVGGYHIKKVNNLFTLIFER
jgi:hypothetical protein